MSKIMTRDAAEFWWSLPINGVERPPFKAPKEVSHWEWINNYERWEPVTWKAIHEERTTRIRMNIKHKRAHQTIKPCLVWVVDEGPHDSFTRVVIQTLHKRFHLYTYDYEFFLKKRLMEAFPLYLPFDESFYDWMRLFIKKYRKKAFRKTFPKQGITTAWCKLTDYGRLIDVAKERSQIVN